MYGGSKAHADGAEIKDKVCNNTEFDADNEYGLFGDDDGTRLLAIDNSIYCLAFFCLIEKIRIDFHLTNNLEDYFFKATMIFFIQFLLTVFIFYSALANADNLDYEMPSFN